MKFKQVEVSAFRIYDKPEDATFDFTTNNGDIANFVSLYAPNGFGKTSFYDAIEWGVTNNVQRFWQNKNTQESIDALKTLTNEQVKLLRNTNSNRGTETFVKITTDKETREPRYLYTHGLRKTDINKPHEFENQEFRQVILSQEWISSFLKEVDGGRRYQLFMQNPDLVEIDNYYKGIKALYNENQKMMDSIKSSIEEIKKEIQPKTDFNPLETINNEINQINKKLGKESLKLITLNTTKEQLKEFQDDVAGKKVDNDKELKIREKLSQIKIAKIGEGSIIGVDRFYALDKDLKGVNERLKEINTSLEKFKELDKKQVEIENLKNNLSELSKLKLEYQEILRDYNYFKERNEVFKEKIKTLSSLEKDQLENSKQVGELTKEESIFSNQNESLIKQKLEIEKQENNLPKITERNISIQKELEKQNKSLEENKLEIEKKDSKIGLINNEIKELEEVKKETENNEYSLISLGKNSELIELTKSLENLDKIKHQLLKELKELDEKINQQQSLRATLEDFIKSGLTIANDLQKSTCPLCEHQYNSYKELAKSISNNKALDSTLQELLSQKNKLNENIENNARKIKQGNEKLIHFYNEKIDGLIKEQKIHKEQKINLNKSRKELTTTLEKLKNEEKEISVTLNGLSLEDFKLQIEKSNLKNTKDSTEVNKKLVEIKKQLLAATEKQKNINSEIEQIKNENNLLEKDKKYLKISNWLTQNLTSEDKSKSGIEKKTEQISSKVKEIRKRISENQGLVENYKKELSQLKQEELVKSESHFRENKKNIEQKIEEFAYFINDKFDVDINNYDKESLSKFLDDREYYFKVELQKDTLLKEGFSKIEKYAENIFPFLQSEKAKEELIEKETGLHFIETKVTPLA